MYDCIVISSNTFKPKYGYFSGKNSDLSGAILLSLWSKSCCVANDKSVLSGCIVGGTLFF